MKNKKICVLLLTFMFIFSSLLLSACSAEDFVANNNKYGYFNLTYSNVEDFVDSPTITSASYNNDNNNFELGMTIKVNSKIDAIKEDIKIDYVLNIIISFKDSRGVVNTKSWENITLNVVIQNGEKQPVENIEPEPFGENTVTLMINYADVSEYIGAYVEVLYIKKVEGRVFINKPTPSSSLVS